MPGGVSFARQHFDLHSMLREVLAAFAAEDLDLRLFEMRGPGADSPLPFLPDFGPAAGPVLRRLHLLSIGKRQRRAVIAQHAGQFLRGREMRMQRRFDGGPAAVVVASCRDNSAA